jgi:hypothetical protein
VKTFSEIDRLPEFDKDMKKLLKKFRTLEEDLDIFIRTELVLYHKLRKDNKGIFPIPGLGIEKPKIYKAKKFACRSIKGRGVQSGIRIIYGYFEEGDRIELIEIYHKGDKENEDRDRVIRNYRERSMKGGETEKT